MKKSAFTLIELVATVAILAIIFAFTMPSLVELINKNKTRNEDVITEKVISAAKDYIADYDKTFTTNFTNVGDTKYISLELLLDAGLIDESDIEVLGSGSKVRVELQNNEKFSYSITAS